MKILISASSTDKNGMMDTRFGRCQYFQIHDTEEQSYKSIENKGFTCGGGAGIAAAQQVIDEKVDVIITGSLGPNAYGLIDKAGIRAYKCNSILIPEAIEKYKSGELVEITQSGPAHQGSM